MKQLFQILILLFSFSVLHGQKKVSKISATKAGKSNPVAASVARGKALYAANCLVCHQADGGGVPNLNPPLTNTEWVTGATANLVQFVLKGSKGQVEIDSAKFHNAMPAQAHLSDVQIADVLTYVRKNFGNKSAAVTAAEVAAERAKTN